jgi:hypothetical protein
MGEISKGHGGIGNKVEALVGVDATATITGGDKFARRVLNNYSKAAHKEQDRQRIVEDAFPDISTFRVSPL